MSEDASPVRGTVLVTGASSGIGKACALRLDRLGFRVLAGVRSGADGTALLAAASGALRPVHCDLLEPDTIARCALEVEQACRDSSFLGVVNNAGILVSGPLECLPPDALRRQMEVNLVGQLVLIQALLPLLRRGKGRIVNIGSTSGRIPSVFSGAYCASKSAWAAISEVLRRELRPAGIDVVLVEPGVVATPLWAKAAAHEASLEAGLAAGALAAYGDTLRRRRRLLARLGERGASPETVADAVLAALTARRPKARYIVGFTASLKLLAFPFIPRALFDWLADWRSRSAR